MTATAVLETRGLSMAFGGLQVLDRLNFEMRRGERHAVIGPNGAGKSTFVALVSGLLRPTGGTVHLEGQDITARTPQQRVAAGLIRTFQINTLFGSLTPLQSITLALCQRDGVARPSVRPLSHCTPQIEEAETLLRRFGLSLDANVPTQNLPYGQQRLLEFVLAYAMKPRVLLLDEPAAGLSTSQGRALFDQISNLTDGTAVLFIEHDMSIVFDFADRVSVFAGGAVIAQGTPNEIRRHDGVKKAYLGH